jgi:2-dehydro-3-deoxyphosphogluconate aldolase/(4S)-4-hydroxy-2-oxoglutarate aldolase
VVNRQAGVERLCDKGVIAIVRSPSSDQLLEVAAALLRGGVDCIEITMTTPGALKVISECRSALMGAMIGVGSVLDGHMAREAIKAGAQFVISPAFSPEVIEAAHASDLPVIPGAFSPTEILNATAAGADIVKVFPAGQFGPRYLRDILAPMPHLKLSPTGGVDINTAGEWILAGAVTLGIGSSLVTKTALAERNFAQIEDLARQYVRIVAEARAARGPRRDEVRRGAPLKKK